LARSIPTRSNRRSPANKFPAHRPKIFGKLKRKGAPAEPERLLFVFGGGGISLNFAFAQLSEFDLVELRLAELSLAEFGLAEFGLDEFGPA
jgi:hypothetical protein